MGGLPDTASDHRDARASHGLQSERCRTVFDLGFALSIIPKLLVASIITIEATIVSFAISVLGGVVVLSLCRSPLRPVAAASRLAAEFIRNTPLLVQLYFLYFIGPQFGLVLSPLLTGILGLSIHYSCFMAEAYRGGLEAIPRGQWDAAVALNYSRLSIYRRVVLPQMLPAMIPIGGNFLIYMFKDTPFLAAISVTELMHTASQIGADRFQYLEPITLCGLIFLILSVMTAAALGRLEKWVGRGWR